MEEYEFRGHLLDLLSDILAQVTRLADAQVAENKFFAGIGDAEDDDDYPVDPDEPWKRS